MSRQFDSVGSSGESTKWNPQLTEKNNFVMSAENVREGYYAECKEMPGEAKYENKPYKIHVIHEVKEDGTFGEKWGVIGDKILNDRMDQIKVGNFIRLEYNGKTRLKATPASQNISKTNSFHNWTLGVDHSAIPYNQALNAAVVEGGGEEIKNGATGTSIKNTNVPAQNSTPAFDESDELPF